MPLFFTVDFTPISTSTPFNVRVTAGESISLPCYVDITPHPLPVGTSTPEFEWFFGPTSLTSTTYNNNSTYVSMYVIAKVRERDGGMYTCRLRGNHRMAVSTMVTVEPGEIKASIEQCQNIHLHKGK